MTSLPLRDPTSLLNDLDFVRSLARQLCHNRHAAEDVAQATIASAIESPPKKAENWHGWLATVARNLAHKHYRTEARLKARELRVAKSGTAPSTDEVVAREELRATVVKSVLALPEPYRKIVLLRHFNGLEVAACAASLGIPESTARTQLSRALERLRQQLDQHHHGDRKAWLSGLLPFAMPTTSTAQTLSATAVSTNKKAIAILIAASLVIGWFTWPLGQGATPPPMTGKVAQASALATPGSNNKNAATQLPSAPLPSERQDAEIAAKNPWTATGTVLRSEDDQGLAGASVYAWATVGERHHHGKQIALGDTLTAADGTFTLPIGQLRTLTPIVQAQVFITARMDAVGYQTGSVEVMLRDILTGHQQGKLDSELSAEVVTKGRVVTTNGTPVEAARLLLFTTNGKQEYETEFDGTFTIDTRNSEEPAMWTLIAVHDRFGRSEAVMLRSDEARERRLADLILRPVGQRIEGFVHYPDGQPVADQDVSIIFDDEDERAPVFLNGLEIEAFEDALQGTKEITTDRFGRFTYHNVRYGKYEIELGGRLVQPLLVRPGQQVTHMDLEYRDAHYPAQIEVILEDEQGTWLPEAFYGVHIWHGSDAIRAQARFLSEGATPALMTTSSDHDAMYTGSDRFFAAKQDTFTVFESCCHNSGPDYGACLLKPEQNRGKVRIVLAGRTATGSMSFDVRDNRGEQVTPLWIRMCRIPTLSGLPLCFPGKETTYAPPSEIAGRWHRVPASGRMHGLPAGQLTVEVLPGPNVENGRLQLCAFPILRHTVVVPEHGTATITDRATGGTPLVVEVQLPQVAPNERLSDAHAQVGLVPITGGRMRFLNLHPLDGSRKVKFTNGRCVARSLGTFKPGTYQLSYSPNLSLQRLKPGDGKTKDKWQLTKTRWRKVKRTIELRAGMKPIELLIERL